MPLVRNGNDSLVATPTVDVPEAADTVTKGFPPTSLPKSSTTMAGAPPDGTLSTVDPLWPVSAPALVTEPCVRTTPTGRTVPLDGAGTRACQFGLAGQVGRSATVATDSTGTAREIATNTAVMAIARLVMVLMFPP